MPKKVNAVSPTRYEIVTAVVIINKLDAIGAIEPEFAEILRKKFADLEFLAVEAEFADTADEGPIYLSKKDNRFVQAAFREGTVVRVSSFGLQTTKEELAALLFHEVVYALTKAQGDETSARARQINGMLFRNDPTGNNVRRAFALLKKQS